MPSFTRRVPERVGAGRAFASASVSASPASSSTISNSPAVPATKASSSTSASTPAAAPAPAQSASASTGIGSLNDILGTFSPGSTLLLLAPDAHTAWSRLVARHIAAQGLLEGARVVVAASDPGAWIKGVVWTGDDAEIEEKKDEEEKEGDKDTNERGFADRRIAWRYDSLTFETTVGTTALDASRTLPPAIRTRAESDGRLVSIPFDSDDGGMGCLASIASALDRPCKGVGVARVVVEVSPEHEFTSPGLTRFLLALRALMRAKGAVAVITLPPRLSSSPPSGSASEWINTLAHAADATLTLAGFGTNPLAKAYAPAHGLLTPHSLPCRGHILAPAFRHSTLLGVNGGSEQNLGFRLKRRRWVVETVHLGIEGGGSERRTEPVAKVVKAQPAEVEGVEPARVALQVEKTIEKKEEKVKKPRAKVRFGEDMVVSHDTGHEHHDGCGHKKSAPKVAIRHDRPDLYEF